MRPSRIGKRVHSVVILAIFALSGHPAFSQLTHELPIHVHHQAMQLVLSLCNEARRTCVIDLTSNRNEECNLVVAKDETRRKELWKKHPPKDVTGNGEGRFAQFLGLCPMYQRHDEDEIIIIEPRVSTDTAMSMIVGPYHFDGITPEDLMYRMFSDSKLSYYLEMGGGYMSIPYEHQRARIDIERTTFQKALNAAAKQFPSHPGTRRTLWIVERWNDGRFSAHTLDNGHFAGPGR